MTPIWVSMNEMSHEGIASVNINMLDSYEFFTMQNIWCVKELNYIMNIDSLAPGRCSNNFKSKIF